MKIGKIFDIIKIICDNMSNGRVRMNFWMQLITTIAEIALIGYLCKLSYEKGMIDHEQSIDIRGNENSPEGSSIGNSGARVQYIVSDPIEYHGPRKK